ncbi:MAG: DUF1643 domain-containing protein [Dehalococcoidia bacterium]
MRRTASFSRDRRFRYELGRRWGDGPLLTWVMLNPSAADAYVDDPTIRRCIGFSRNWGFGGMRVVNLAAFRAAHPAALAGEGDLLGPDGARRLRRALIEAETVIAAWGNVPSSLVGRAEESVRRLPPDAWCLGLTAQGQPRHPLYVRGDVTPVPFLGALSVFGGAPTMAA